MINADKLQQLKESADILEIFKNYNLEPERKGKGYFVQCPFHKDDTASLSITPKKKLWQCFGCGESGDMISFIQRKEGCSFPEAAKKLADLEGLSVDSLIVTETKKPLSISSTVQYLDLKIEKEKDNTPAPVKSNPSPFTDSEILSKVTGYYHQTFLTKSEGKTYLKSRGITKEELFATNRVGYSNGTLLHVIPKEDAVYDKLIRLGILLENKGRLSHKERFLNCVIFPITNEAGDVVGVYGRHIHMKEGGHFYLPGARSGLFNESYLKTEKPAELVITESIIDALSFMERGILNVLPIYGINGFTKAHETLLIELKPCRLIIALDGDEQGKQAAEKLKEKLTLLFNGSSIVAGNNCHTVIFPHDQDANEYFIKNSAKDFWYLTKEAGQVKQTPLPQSSFSIAHSLFKIKWAEVKGTKLNVTLKAENPQTKRFILDTFNLYSERDRTKLAGKAAELFKLSHDQLDKDILEWIPDVEKQARAFKENPEQLKGMTASPENILTEYEEQEAHSFLQSPNLIEDIKKDYSELGYIGEETNKLLAYLVMTSRKMKNPLSLIIMSNSAAGKSSLQKATMELCPEEDGKHFTRLTQQSLYYLGEESIKHKCLSIEEEEGTADASYSLKTLLSAKVLNVAVTTQDPQTGKKRAEEYKTEGPVAVMVSTTSPEIEPELESRTLVISVDESEKQTSNIQAEQKQARTLKGQTVQAKREAVKKKHANAQRMLESGLTIVNNYAPQLTFPVQRLRYRRTHSHYLDLIDVIAFLRQKQKVQRICEHIGPYIEVEKKDIALANEIFIQIMGQTLSELKTTTVEVLEKIILLCKEKGGKEFSRRELREFSHYSNTHLHRQLKLLEELEYIAAVSGVNGSKYVYQLIYEGEFKKQEKFVPFLKQESELKDA